MGIWESVGNLMLIGRLAVEDGAALVRAAIGAHADMVSGKAKDPVEALRNQMGNVMPILEDVVSVLFPGATVASVALAAAAYMITHAHKMSLDEEKRWMDRASQAGG